MISVAGSVTPTRIIGLSADVFALASCSIAWIRGRSAEHRARLAATLFVLEAVLLFDLVFNARWRLHDLLVKAAMASHMYRERSGPQVVALGVLGTVVAIGIGLTLWHFKARPGAALASCGGILSVCCWFVEVISLHGFDSLLYRRVDGVTLVRLAWAMWSLMTGAGILWDALAVHAPYISRIRPTEGRHLP